MNPRSWCRHLAAVLLFLVAAPAQAAFQCKGDSAERAAQLAGFADQLEAAALGFAARGVDAARALESAAADLRAQVKLMTPEDVQDLCDSLAASPELAALPELLGETSALSQVSRNASLPCVNLSRQAWDAAFATAQALRFASIVATGICSGTGCLPLVCKIPCKIKAVAKAAATIADAVIDRAAYCADAQDARAFEAFTAGTSSTLAAIAGRFDVLRPRVDVPVSSRATQGQIDALRQRQDVGVATLDTRIESVRQFALANATRARQSSGGSRRQMSESALSAGFEAPVVTLMLPASRGGQIEALREQVAGTLQVYAGLGVDTSAARARFAAGDVALNARSYRAAYLAYRDAYRLVTSAAVKPGEKE